MPYVAPACRSWLQSFLNLGRASGQEYASIREGDLNFLVTTIVLWWIGPNPNYARFNAAVGALECAKLELYRRRVAPYEDGKIIENGDVE